MKLKNYLLNKSFFLFIFFFIIIFHCSITQSNEISEKKLLSKLIHKMNASRNDAFIYDSKMLKNQLFFVILSKTWASDLCAYSE